MKLNSGQYQDFYWIETNEINLTDLVLKLPELFLGKYLIIISFDGGTYTIKNEELSSGWKYLNGMTYTEIITKRTLHRKLSDNHDQWVLLENNRIIDTMINFVNYTYFSLIDWDKEINYLEDEDDQNFIKRFEKERSKLRERFWEQINIINPLTFISDGSKLIFVTKDEKEIELIKNLPETN